MSNLNMPNMTHAAILDRFFSRRGEWTRKIVYATTATLVLPQEHLIIRQHGNAIAEIGTAHLRVTNAGYGSSSTRERLNAILSSHGLPFYVAQRQGDQVLYLRVSVLVDGIGEHVELTRNFESITFDLAARVYSLNGSAAVGY
jgi:hypothetical protein